MKVWKFEEKVVAKHWLYHALIAKDEGLLSGRC